jgi:autotransporter passenger strand-loop-strand repeat protein
MTTVGFGQTSAVGAGQSVSGWIVENGGILNVMSGGVASGTTVSDGELNVSSGGKTVGTTLSGGIDEYAYAGGTAIGTTIDYNSIQYIYGVASGTVVNWNGTSKPTLAARRSARPSAAEASNKLHRKVPPATQSS